MLRSVLSPFGPVRFAEGCTEPRPANPPTNKWRPWLLAERLAPASIYGLGAGVWTRDGTRAYKMGRAIKAGRVWTNCYHQYPAGAAFGGYKISGIGRENHRMILDHYSQTKNLLVSYDPQPLGLF